MEMNKEQPTQEIVQAKLEKRLGLEKLDREKSKSNEAERVTDFTTFMEDFISIKRSNGMFLQKLEQAQKAVLVAFNLISKKNLKQYNSLSIKEKSRTILKADRKLPFEQVNLKFIQDFRMTSSH